MTDTRTRLHHAASQAATLIENTGRGTKREGDVLAELRAALEADAVPQVVIEDGTTPGPWHYENRYGHSRTDMRFVVFADTAERIAVCSRAGLTRSDEEEPNAALITSAPTMRDELRAWREAVTVERLDALQSLLFDEEPIANEYVFDVKDLLTALRVLAAGDAGKGGGTV